MLEELKSQVLEANLELVRRGVVVYTWGNVSGLDRTRGLVVIKPSGVPYESMAASDMVVVELATGRVVEGSWRPSSDTPTHLELYRAFPSAAGIAHTHSPRAVAFAQAGLDLPALGTTHADYFHGPVPCTRALSPDETAGDYELNTGRVVAGCFAARHIDPSAVPAALVRNHGPFAWGKTPADAVLHAVVLEVVAGMALDTLALAPSATLPPHLLDKHYLRKHGPGAYYGQEKG
jgi:L-ribulose-5-phosphate 4-epimerase